MFVGLLIGSIFALVGFGILYYGIRERGVLNELRAGGLEAQATVFSVVRKVSRDSDGDTDVDWEVSYRFDTMSGQSFSNSKTWETARNLPREGDMLPVIYMPDNPDRHRLTRDVEGSGTIIALYIMGAVFTTVGVGVAILSLAGVLE